MTLQRLLTLTARQATRVFRLSMLEVPGLVVTANVIPAIHAGAGNESK
jgi:hypothetical protein